MALNYCERCGKEPSLCVCSAIEPVRTRTEVLILQHPQEPDKKLGTAGIAHACLPSSRLQVGLSWPNLERALGRKANRAGWAVLYLGSAKNPGQPGGAPLYLFGKDKQLLPLTAERKSSITGLVALDGTWSQAKALWWRNAWLTKLKRLVLIPEAPSAYGKLRKEPRPESVSTLESLGLTLAELENDQEILRKLLKPFGELLRKYRGPGFASQP